MILSAVKLAFLEVSNFSTNRWHKSNYHCGRRVEARKPYNMLNVRVQWSEIRATLIKGVVGMEFAVRGSTPWQY
jgi:hypothetical protein